MRIFGVILAGGAARRMGTDKALVPLAGKPLIEWVAERLSPQVEALAISANGDPARFSSLHLPILPDAAAQGGMSDGPVSKGFVPNDPVLNDPVSKGLVLTDPLPSGPVSKGPLSGILAALKWAEPLGATAVVSTPCDSPFLPPDLVPRLCLAAEAQGMSYAISGADQHPTHALWPVGLIPALEAFLSSGAVPRLRDFALQQGAGLAACPPGSFANANSPADLARLEALLAEAR